MSLDLSALSSFIFDLDGVIWRGDTPVPYAVESVTALQEAGKRCYFATNNSSRPQRYYAERLNRMGIGATPEDIMTSAIATALYLKREVERGALPPRFTAYVVGEEGINVALRNIGARVLAPDEGRLGAHVVVVGIDRNFTYEKLKVAQDLILRGARFVATNRDATFPVEGGVVPGAGSIVGCVEIASGTAPISIGKPEPAMLTLLLENDGIKPDDAAMIGDRLDTDIACAHRAQMLALLVCTGVTNAETGRAATGEYRPDSIYADLRELVADAVESTG